MIKREKQIKLFLYCFVIGVNINFIYKGEIEKNKTGVIYKEWF